MNRYNIGRRIEAYRDRQKMSTQELAERINRSQATISRIENGKQGLTFELLSAIAAELRVHPFSLLADDPPRPSVLLPAEKRENGGEDGEYSPNLLANALHAGRVRSRLGIGAAAGMLGVDEVDLEAMELAQKAPDDALLGRIASLYGLRADELSMLRGFGEAAPDLAKSLAYLQQLSSHIYHMIQSRVEGEEERILEKILAFLESADTGKPLPPESASDDVGLFLNRLSLHLVNALRDNEFRGRMFQMAGVNTEREHENRLN